MKHLIIGCGYLGRVVAARWLHEGHDVSALTRGQGDALQTLGITPILGDVTQANLVLPPADTVLYAVGLDRRAGKSMREVYLDGLANMLRVLPAVRRFIYVSSTSVYGQTTGEWVDESAPTAPVEESGKIIVACEELLRAQRPDALILRFAGIYGPKRVLRRATITAGEPLPTDPTKWLNLIHVADGASAVVQATTHGRTGCTYNIADDEPVTRHDFYTTMAQLLQAPAPNFVPTPDDGNNRRIANAKMHAELHVALQFPNYVAGLREAITSSSA